MKKVKSFEAADNEEFGDILNVARTKYRAKVGLLGCGYFEYWRMYPGLQKTVQRDLEKVHKNLSRDLEVVYPGMVDTLDAAEKAGKVFAESRIDLLVVVEGTYLPDFMTLQAIEHVSKVPVILFNIQTESDVSPDDDYAATLRNSSLIGISQLTGTFHKINKKYQVVVGEINEEDAYKQIKSLVKAYEITRRLRSYTIGIIGQVFRGMFDLECDRAKVKGFLGPEVMTIQIDHLVKACQEVSEGDAKKAAGKLLQRFSAKGITREDAEKSCRLGLAMRKITKQYRLDALCFLGQHYIEKKTGAPARMGASMLIEEDRFMVACEGDVGGLVMMQIMYELTGNVPLQAEWGQFDVKNNALFLLGHGITSPELASGEAKVTLTRSPEEWGFQGNGINYQLIIKPGKVTLGHFLNTAHGWQMFISEGEALEFPSLPCDEIHALVRVEKPVKEYLAEVLKNGVAHHLIVVHGEVVPELTSIADFMGIDRLILK